MTARRRALLARHGLEIIEDQPLSVRLPASVFRLQLADGRQVKLRLFTRSARARDVWRILRTHGTGLPKPVMVTGRCLVLEYVPGVALDVALDAARTDSLARALRDSGALLARLHRAPRPDVAAPAYLHSRWLITRVVRALQGRQLMRQADARRLVALDVPRDRHVAISHGDPSPDNIVRTASGALRLIDEDRLSVRPPAFDLARMVTRWRLTAALETELLTGYAAGGGTVEPYLEHRAFWTATALATSAIFRLAGGGKELTRIANALRATPSRVQAFTR